MKVNKDLRALVRAAKRQGWEVGRTRGQHVRLTPPDGGSPVIVAGTPSCPRAMKNARAELRRRGVLV